MKISIYPAAVYLNRNSKSKATNLSRKDAEKKPDKKIFPFG